MGSWNGTCGISHLPIVYGDPIVAILIARYEDQKLESSGYCYINSFYNPLTLPILCEYDDYGGFDRVKNLYLLDLIKKQFNLDEDTSVVQWINSSVLGNEVTIQHQFFEDYPFRTASVGVWLAHRQIYEDFKKREREEWPYSNYSHGESVRLDSESVFSYLKSNKNRIIEYQKDRSPINYIYLGLNPRSQRNVLIPSGNWDNTFSLSLGFGGGYAGDGSLTKDYFDVYRQYMLDGIISEIDLKDFVEDVAGYFSLISEMSSLRIGFVPQTGCGSQSESYNSYINLMKSITQVIKEKEKSKQDFSMQWEQDEEDRFKGFKW